MSIKSNLEKVKNYIPLLSNLSAYNLLIIVSLVYVIFLFPSPEYNRYNKDDASFFLTLGINLADYGRYTTDTFPQENYGRHATWPFVFPMLLAAIVSVFGVSWVALKLFMVTLGLANLYLLRKIWPDNELGVWAVLLTGLGPAYFLFSHTTMTEIPYMLAVSATILAMERTKSSSGALGAGLLATLAFFTRGYAITFLPAGVIFYLLRGSWPMRQRVASTTFFVLPLLLGIGAWIWYTQQVLANEELDWVTSHFGNGLNLLSRVQRPLIEHAREFFWYNARFPLHFILPIFSLRMLQNDLLAFFSMGLLALAGLGWLLALRHRVGAVEVWLPCAIGLLLISSPSPRYWLTFTPFLFFFLLFLVRKIQLYISRPRWFYPSIVSCCFIIALWGLTLHLTDPDQLRFLNTYWRDYQTLAVWARRNLPESAIVVAHHPHNFYVASRRRVYSIEKVNPEKWPPPELKAESNIYILNPEPIREDKKLSDVLSHSNRLLHRHTNRFQKVHQEGQASLYVDQITPADTEN